MATSAWLIRKNGDDGYSCRNHHWDGSPQVLGFFLAEQVDKNDVDWLFGLEKNFATIMENIPKPGRTSRSDGRMMHWPGNGRAKKNTCLGVYRDEEYSSHFPSWDALARRSKNEDVAYFYIFDAISGWEVVTKMEPEKINLLNLDNLRRGVQLEQKAQENKSEMDPKEIRLVGEYVASLSTKKRLEFFSWVQRYRSDEFNGADLLLPSIIQRQTIAKTLGVSDCAPKRTQSKI